MSQRLVRHKPSTYRYTESTAFLFALLVTMTSARVVEQTLMPPHPIYGFPFIAMIASLLLYPVVATIWARFQNLELMPYAETVRRAFEERTSVSIFDYAWRMALLVGSMILISVLTISPIEAWPALAPLVALALFAGFISGTYAALNARRWKSAKDFSALPVVTARERNARHYFGYVVGLAAAFAAAAQLGDGPTAAEIIAVAFVTGKFVADLVLPQPPYNFAAPLRFRWLDPLRVVVFGVLRWGVPLSVLAFLLTRTIWPESRPEDLVVAMIAPLIMGGVWGLSFWLIALFVRWGQKPKAMATA